MAALPVENTEMGAHIALVCRELEYFGVGRRFGSWEQADDPNRVIRKREEVDEFRREKVTTVDLTESFFAELGDI